jgi:hypothetical protein
MTVRVTMTDDPTPPDTKMRSSEEASTEASRLSRGSGTSPWLIVGIIAMLGLLVYVASAIL